MNPEAQELFDSITIKTVGELTPFEVAFLNARRGYLNAEQIKKYASILKEVPKTPSAAKKPKTEYKAPVEPVQPEAAPVVPEPASTPLPSVMDKLTTMSNTPAEVAPTPPGVEEPKQPEITQPETQETSQVPVPPAVPANETVEETDGPSI